MQNLQRELCDLYAALSPLKYGWVLKIKDQNPADHPRLDRVKMDVLHRVRLARQLTFKEIGNVRQGLENGFPRSDSRGRSVPSEMRFNLCVNRRPIAGSSMAFGRSTV